MTSLGLALCVDIPTLYYIVPTSELIDFLYGTFNEQLRAGFRSAELILQIKSCI